MLDERLYKGSPSGLKCWIAKDSSKIYYLIRNLSGKHYQETVEFDLNNCRIEGEEDAEGLEFELDDGEETMITLVKVPYAREFSMNLNPKFKFR